MSGTIYLTKITRKRECDKSPSRGQKRLKNKMKTISIKWGTEDVLWQADNLDIELTEEQADDILESLENKHDASIGINWDVISYYIEDYLRK